MRSHNRSGVFWDRKALRHVSQPGCGRFLAATGSGTSGLKAMEKTLQHREVRTRTHHIKETGVRQDVRRLSRGANCAAPKDYKLTRDLVGKNKLVGITSRLSFQSFR